MCKGKLFAAVIMVCLLILAAPPSADIHGSVLTLLTGLSRDYVEYREEVFFKSPLAVVPFINAGPLASEHEIGAVVDELINDAQAFKYEYVTRYGLGLQALADADIAIGGIPRMDSFDSLPTIVHTGAGISYRPWRFLQISASMNVTWTELRYGAFDPTAPDYDNTSWLPIYYAIPLLSDTSLPKYSVEYTQK